MMRRHGEAGVRKNNKTGIMPNAILGNTAGMRTMSLS
jgi:hypothetical protein